MAHFQRFSERVVTCKISIADMARLWSVFWGKSGKIWTTKRGNLTVMMMMMMVLISCSNKLEVCYTVRRRGRAHVRVCCPWQHYLGMTCMGLRPQMSWILKMIRENSAYAYSILPNLSH